MATRRKNLDQTITQEILRQAKKRRAPAGSAPSRRQSSRRRPAPKKPPTLEEIMAIADPIIDEYQAMIDRGEEPPEIKSHGKSRYGLPKASIYSTFDASQYGKTAARWQRIMNRYDAQLEDISNALEAGVIDAARAARDRKPLGEKFRAARSQMENAIRVAQRGLETPRQQRPLKRQPAKKRH